MSGQGVVIAAVRRTTAEGGLLAGPSSRRLARVAGAAARCTATGLPGRGSPPAKAPARVRIATPAVRHTAARSGAGPPAVTPAFLGVAARALRHAAASVPGRASPPAKRPPCM